MRKSLYPSILITRIDVATWINGVHGTLGKNKQWNSFLANFRANSLKIFGHRKKKRLDKKLFEIKEKSLVLIWRFLQFSRKSHNGASSEIALVWHSDCFFAIPNVHQCSKHKCNAWKSQSSFLQSQKNKSLVKSNGTTPKDSKTTGMYY